MVVKLPYSTEQEITANNIPLAGAAQGGPEAAPDADLAGLGNSSESGTARARRLLVNALAGLARPRGVAAATHDAELDRLARKLSYMDEAALSGLCELALAHAGTVGLRGKALPVCPPLAMVQAWAYALQAPPVNVSDYPASVLRSAMGRRAFDAGYGVELLRMARKFGPPPGAYSLVALRDQAEANHRRRAALRVEIEAGRGISPDAARWLDAWHADAATVEGLIAEGDDRRAARAAAQGGET